jgi:hypothetical protein
VENECCAKHRGLLGSKPENIPNTIKFSSPIVSISGEYSFDRFDWFRDEKEYIMPHNMAETTP